MISKVKHLFRRPVQSLFGYGVNSAACRAKSTELTIGQIRPDKRAAKAR